MFTPFPFSFHLALGFRFRAHPMTAEIVELVTDPRSAEITMTRVPQAIRSASATRPEGPTIRASGAHPDYAGQWGSDVRNPRKVELRGCSAGQRIYRRSGLSAPAS